MARAEGAVVVGIDAHVIEVEAQITPGLPGTVIVGLPDAAVGEARDRARAAVVSCGLEWPKTRVTVGLSPASLPKRGSALDLPIALAVMMADAKLPAQCLQGVVLLGELGLDGRIRPVRGVVAVVREMIRRGRDKVIVPVENLAEAQLVPGVSAIGVASLRQVIAVLNGTDSGVAQAPREVSAEAKQPPDLADVRGQQEARQALEVAAAGGHHLLLGGPPGVGKTLIAECLPGILPPLDQATALEVTAIHSVEGRLGPSVELMSTPPFVAPHHSASLPSLVGGGAGHAIRAGALSLAHGGVLFLDEAAEFAPATLDAMRQPLESGEVRIHRSGVAACFPARVQLVVATNPCPCGHGGSTRCRCTPHQRRRYLGRLSGPLLDRVDIRIGVSAPTRADLLGLDEPESSAAVAERVSAARERAAHRLCDEGVAVNARVSGAALRRRFPPGRSALPLLERAVAHGELSMRGADRVLRTAWTLADLGGIDEPGRSEVSRALELRQGFDLALEQAWG